MYISLTNNGIPSYNKILVPHDGSEMSDKSLKHAIYLSSISKANIIILSILEFGNIPPSVLLAFISEGEGIDKAKERLRDLLEQDTRQMSEEKVKSCKEHGIKDVTYFIKEGKPSDEIINSIETIDPDVVVMANSRISSAIRVLGSNARKVLDSTQKPVLLIHE